MDYNRILEQLKRKPRVHGYVSPKTETRPSHIQGLGLFAIQIIRVGEVVAAWGGKIATQAEIDTLPKDIASNYAFELHPGFYLAETRQEELDAADFINHSCEPNCKIESLLFMVAAREISPGEELTVDFSNNDQEGISFRCGCGSKACKGLVYSK